MVGMKKIRTKSAMSSVKLLRKIKHGACSGKITAFYALQEADQQLGTLGVWSVSE